MAKLRGRLNALTRGKGKKLGLKKQNLPIGRDTPPRPNPKTTVTGTVGSANSQSGRRVGVPGAQRNRGRVQGGGASRAGGAPPTRTRPGTVQSGGASRPGGAPPTRTRPSGGSAPGVEGLVSGRTGTRPVPSAARPSSTSGRMNTRPTPASTSTGTRLNTRPTPAAPSPRMSGLPVATGMTKKGGATVKRKKRGPAAGGY